MGINSGHTEVKYLRLENNGSPEVHMTCQDWRCSFKKHLHKNNANGSSVYFRAVVTD